MPSAETLAAGSAAPMLARSRACILDPRLALSGVGLLAAARLSTECSVWLPRELRETLRGSRAYQSQAGKLAPRVYGAQTRGLPRRDDDIRDALQQWESVLQGPLATLRLYYMGERPGDSLLPGSLDHEVHARFEHFASDLDGVVRSVGFDLPRGEVLAACFRDTAALCAALAPYGAFILSVLESDGKGAPALCNYLDAWDLPVADVTARAGTDAEVLRWVLGRAGLGPIEWTGARFAAVHVVPPGLGISAGEAIAWNRVKVFWHLL